jgi:SAM-dependent methyltransferase
MPTEAELTSYYNSSYTVPYARYRARVDEEFPLLERLLNRASVRRGRMLEIGCSYGNMLARFGAEGWSVEGVEIDARAAAHARDVLGLVVHNGSLDDVRAALGAPYDLIAMYHVIEHERCVARLVESLESLLAPGGFLLLKTPNAASLASRVLQGWWEWSAVPEHVHLFTSASLRTLLVRAGFDPELLLTRRGDAKGTLHELLHAGVRRLIRSRPRGERIFEAADGGATLPPPISRSPLYAVVARILDGSSRPLDWLLDVTSKTTGTAFQPEILVVARRSVAVT